MLINSTLPIGKISTFDVMHAMYGGVNLYDSSAIFMFIQVVANYMYGI